MKAKKLVTNTKTKLHPRNKHRERYDFEKLTGVCAGLKPFVFINPYSDESIDFANPLAVKMLNKSLLKVHYGIDFWDIPEGYLCPPIPGRADYIHYVADVLAENNLGKIPKKNITCLDLGVGANCVYPIIGNTEYGWNFIGSDIDKTAIENAQKIVSNNPVLEGKIELRLQQNKQHFFKGIITENERIDFTVCNPPFHASPAEAQAGTLRKLNNLNQKKHNKVKLNFGGKNNELWCEGGEKTFIQKMILESKTFQKNVLWFSSLVSKSEHLKSIYATLKNENVFEYKTIEMGQGNKISRIVIWTFLDKNQQKEWANFWNK